VAVAEDSEVATGVHAGDHPIYSVCRPEFVEAFDRMQKKVVEGFRYEALPHAHMCER
jgi:7-cyano-7-deazaguanine synthase